MAMDNISKMMDMMDKIKSSLVDSKWTSGTIEIETDSDTEQCKGIFTKKALDILYKKDCIDEARNLYTMVQRSEGISYLYYGFKTEENKKTRRIIIDICDMLDHGKMIREIAEELHVEYDTVCIVRAFFEDYEEND